MTIRIALCISHCTPSPPQVVIIAADFRRTRHKSGSRPDAAREVSSHCPEVKKCRVLHRSNLVFHLTSSIESDLIPCLEHPDSHFSKPPPVGPAALVVASTVRQTRNSKLGAAGAPPLKLQSASNLKQGVSINLLTLQEFPLKHQVVWRAKRV